MYSAAGGGLGRKRGTPRSEEARRNTSAAVRITMGGSTGNAGGASALPFFCDYPTVGQAMSSSLHMAGSCGLARRCTRAHVVFMRFAGVRRSVERGDSAGGGPEGTLGGWLWAANKRRTGREALWALAQQLPDQ